MRSPLLTPAVLALVAALATGCGKKDSKHDDDVSPAPPTPGNNDQPAPTPTPSPSGDNAAPPRSTDATAHALNCDQTWATMLSTYKPGLTKTYATSTNVGEFETRMQTRETVLEVKPDSIRLEAASKQLEPVTGDETKTETTLTKDDFLKQCSEPGLSLAPSDGDYRTEVLEQRDEKLNVPAGTFDTHFVKARLVGTATSRAYEAITETWMLSDGSGIIVKSELEATSSMDAASYQTHTESVLTELKR